MRLGILINNTSLSQLTLDLALNYSKFNHPDEHLDCTIFALCKQPSLVELPCPVFPAKYSWNYKGSLIATDLKTANVLLECHGTKSKYLYVWDCEWMHSNHQLLDLEHIYMNPKLEIIVRSQDMYDLFTKCWREPKHIVGEFNHAELIRSIGSIQ